MDLSPGPWMRWIARRFDPSLPAGLYVTLGLAGVVLFGAGFLSIAEDVLESASLALDRIVYAALAGVSSPILTRIMWMATVAGDTRVETTITVVAALLLILWGRPRRAVALVALMVAAPTLGTLLKGVFERPRPPHALALVATPLSYSFPSGHALGSIVLYGALALMLLATARPWWVKVAGVAAAAVPGILIGLSRAYLGVHYMSDVLASWLLGAAALSAGMAALLAWERLGEPRAERRFTGSARAWRIAATVVLLALPIVAFLMELPTVPLG